MTEKEVQPYLSIVIPAFNESKNLKLVVEQIYAQNFEFSFEIILIDSGSNDGSKQIIQSFANYSNLKRIFLPSNLGKGFSVRQGLACCRGEIILIQDADLEYSALDYRGLLQPFERDSTQFVLGSRNMAANTWRIRTIYRKNFALEFLNVGSAFLTKLFCFLYQVDISDPLTMFKIFRKSALEGLAFKTQGFDFDWELLCKFTMRGIRPVEIPVSYHARNYEEGKKIRPFKDGIMALLALVRFRFFDVA